MRVCVCVLYLSHGKKRGSKCAKPCDFGDQTGQNLRQTQVEPSRV